ncbi:MAG: Rrf2 family transcriptional regulator [Hyphomicrobium sp.]|jgi:DNA-binding IscR family transcriptional regulator
MAVDFVFSPHSQYAIVCMIMIERSPEPITVGALARGLGLSRPYVTDFIGAFEKHGLVKKGPRFRDGYSLAKSSSRITLGEILAAERETWYHDNFKRKESFVPDVQGIRLWHWFVKSHVEKITLLSVVNAPEEMASLVSA